MYIPHQRGKQAEKAVEHYLQQSGLELIERNYRCNYGEIDLIMKDKAGLTFIEVRARQDKTFSACLESITTHKQHKIAKTALHYLQAHQLCDKIACRFDVVAVNLCNEETPEFQWIKNAFEV